MNFDKKVKGLEPQNVLFDIFRGFNPMDIFKTKNAVITMDYTQKSSTVIMWIRWFLRFANAEKGHLVAGDNQKLSIEPISKGRLNCR